MFFPLHQVEMTAGCSPCHTITHFLFPNHPQSSTTQAKSKPESGTSIKSKQNEALSPQAKLQGHKRVGFRKTTAFSACSTFLRGKPL